MTGELSFNFITDAALRESLISDYKELQSCLISSAWKAVHVLSGSIVEAVLVDYLLGIGSTKPDPLKMGLGELIDACQTAGVLTERTADLSSVIQSYRNLIHPGRVVRLDEKVNEDTAQIANSLIAIIVREVSAKQAQVYGLTAEQLLAKFERDPSAFGIAAHLLKDTKPQELERLLLLLLPQRYFAVQTEVEFGDTTVGALTSLERLYREAFEQAPDEVKQKATKKFVSVLREEAGWKVEAYEEKFFTGTDLEHLSDSERKLVKDHLLSRLKDAEMTPDLIRCVEGLGKFLNLPELGHLVNALVRTVAYANAGSLIESAAERLDVEYRSYLSEKQQKAVLQRLDVWIDHLRTRDLSPAAARLEKLRSDLEWDDIPF